MNTEHVVMTDVTADVALLQCNHCGEQHCPSLPMSAVLLADRLLGFVRMHRLCPKPLEPSKQVELFDALAAKEQALFQRDEHPEHMTVDLGALNRNYVCNPLNGTGPVRHESFAIDANTDEPAPEIDPPALPPGWTESNGAYFKGENLGSFPCDEPEEHDKPELTEGDLPDYYAKFAEMYPMASDPVKLTEQVHRALGNTGAYPHLFDYVAKWHPSTAAFQLVAHWARVECAHLDSEARGISNPIAGLTIPACLPMPAQLQEALRAMNGGKAPKKKRAGARPFTSPSAELPAVAPAKKTRKRRSAVTPNSRT